MDECADCYEWETGAAWIIMRCAEHGGTDTIIPKREPEIVDE